MYDNFSKALIEARNAELKDSNGKVNQTDRNNLRNALMKALCEDLGAIMTVDGAILEFEHEYWGSLCIEIPLKMKDPNYDTDTAHDEYLEKIAKAQAKKADAEAKAIERKAKAEALKQVKEAKAVK